MESLKECIAFLARVDGTLKYSRDTIIGNATAVHVTARNFNVRRLVTDEEQASSKIDMIEYYTIWVCTELDRKIGG